ncbi:zinc ribbon domain-containing protein [bacterium]|nr:zinc ribbon domain-containing protein [bacterium]
MPNDQTAVPPTCPQCGFVNPEGFNFCGKCGAALAAAENPGRVSVKAERRQITVMFCDLVGSTDLSARLDPEDLRELVRDYQEACEKAILAFDGHVAQYLGDGLLVYFGFPRAHENDAQRAVRAGLGILEEMSRLNENLASRNVQLAVRIGIHTGLVVVGEMGGELALSIWRWDKRPISLRVCRVWRSRMPSF